MAEWTWEYRRNKAIIELDNELRAARSSASLGSRSTNAGAVRDRVKSANVRGIIENAIGDPNHNARRLISPLQGGCGPSDASVSLCRSGGLCGGSKTSSADPRPLAMDCQKSAFLAMSEETERLQRRLHDAVGRERALRENLDVQSQIHAEQLAVVQDVAEAKAKSWECATEKIASTVYAKRLRKLAFAALRQRACRSRHLDSLRWRWELVILQNAFLGWLIEAKKRRKREASCLSAALRNWALVAQVKRTTEKRENLFMMEAGFASFEMNVEKRRCQRANEAWARNWRRRRAVATAWKGWMEGVYSRRRKENELGRAKSWWKSSMLRKGCKGWKSAVRQWQQERDFQSRIRTRSLVTSFNQWRQFVKKRKLRKALLTNMDKQHKDRAARAVLRNWHMIMEEVCLKREDLDNRRKYRLVSCAFHALAASAEEARNARDLDGHLVSSAFEAWVSWMQSLLRQKRMVRTHFHRVQTSILRKSLVSWQRAAAASAALSKKSVTDALAAQVKGMAETIEYYKGQLKVLHDEKCHLRQLMTEPSTPVRMRHRTPTIVSECLWSSISCEPPFSPFPRMRHASCRLCIELGEGGDGLNGAVLYGGERDGAWLNDVWVWSASVSDRVEVGWHLCESDLEAMSIAARRDFAMCKVATNKFIVIGGFGGESELGDIHIATLSWSEGDSTRAGCPRVLWTEVNAHGPRFSGRSNHSAEYHSKSNQVCVFGGYQTSLGFLNDTWVLDMERRSWELLPQEVLGAHPPPRRSHASVVVGEHMYIHGGFNGETHFNDLFAFDMSLHQWTEIETKGDIPCGRRSHAIEVINDTFIVLHGGFDGRQILDGVFVLNIANQAWIRINIQGCSLQRALHTLVCCGDQLITCGGMGNEGQEKCMMALENQAQNHILDLELRLKRSECVSSFLADKCNQLGQENASLEQEAMQLAEQQETLQVSLQRVKRNLHNRDLEHFI